MICHSCGNNIDDNYETCPICGVALYAQYDQNNQQYYDDPNAQYNNEYAQSPQVDEFGNYLDDQGQQYNINDFPDSGLNESPQFSQDYPNEEYVDDPPLPEDPDFGHGNYSNKTNIVALDPEFQKGTQIVANPMLEGSSRKRARVRATTVNEDLPDDELSKLIYDFKYVYGRMNFLEKITLIIFSLSIFLSFAPWIKLTDYGTWVSGYESAGIFVAVFATGSILLMMLKIGMRLGIWATALHLFTAFGAVGAPLYIYMRKLAEGQVFVVPFYLTFGLTILGFFVAFLGAMRRLLN